MYVYILISEVNGKHYVGSTNDLHRRIIQYNTDGDKKHFTFRYRPWRLFMFRKFRENSEAREYEKEVKSYKGGNKFKKIINGEVAEWSKALHC